MTIHEILGKHPDEIAKMSTEELTQHLSKYFVVTRPERVATRSDSNRPYTMPKKLDANALRGLEMLKQMGFADLAQQGLNSAKGKKR